MFKKILYSILGIVLFFTNIAFILWIGMLAAIMVATLIVGRVIQEYLSTKEKKLEDIMTSAIDS